MSSCDEPRLPSGAARLGLGAVLVLVVAGAASACSKGESSETTTTSTSTAPTTFGGARPTELFVPDDYDPATPAPLLILLHGYGTSGVVQDLYWNLRPQALGRGFLYARPDGTVDSGGGRFWNATDACCNFDGTAIDDSGYLMGLVDAISAAYAVDPKRVYFTGHSNGGFMSYRLACEHADRIAAIAALAGATYANDADCQPSAPVHVLAMHGTADTDVVYTGGDMIAPHPSAPDTVAKWAAYDGCDPSADTSPPPLDLEENLAGAETTITRYATGCDAGGSAELWSLNGAPHIPALGPGFVPAVLDFLLAHPKP